jgi:N-acetylneuraminic acid mutarotase
VSAGGDNSDTPLSDALLYDPSNNTWTSIPPPLPIGDQPTATVLQSGKVLITYYFGGGNSVIFNPATNSWESETNTLGPHEFGSTATLLSDGKVVVTGGLNYHLQRELPRPRKSIILRRIPGRWRVR